MEKTEIQRNLKIICEITSLRFILLKEFISRNLLLKLGESESKIPFDLML